MNPTEIEFAFRDLASKPYNAETFPYDLLAIFNASKITVSRLKSGTTNKATRHSDVLWQKQFFFRPAEPGEDVGGVADALMADPLTARHQPRFILVTNGQQVHIRDLKFEDTANIEFERLDEQTYFLLPLAGYERRAIVEEHPADIKAAKKLKKLYDSILAANPTWNGGHHSHELNLLMTRVLFCFYADDTGIFNTPQLFTNTVTQNTTEDGADVAPLLDRLFRVMNLEVPARARTTPAIDLKFPYVNGSLFEDTVAIPQFSRTARRQLLECGDLDWTMINPDIFGSMIQAVAQDESRSDLGMHYTSVPNIMKVLQPLFLDDLNQAYARSKDSVAKLELLLGRLSEIRVFDPACGSGNFLVIAYKEIRKLEIEILKRIDEIAPQAPLRLSNISLEHFYGIDVVDFACETAKLSLWIAEHQLNTAFKDLFGHAKPSVPLAKITTIHRANATRVDWLQICPPRQNAETYIFGNPPYHGKKYQTTSEKQDLANVFSSVSDGYRELDYVSSWFYLATRYISAQRSARVAFVATNSISQGAQVAVLWPLLLNNGISISFARTSFRWSNNAVNNAGVTCVVIGLASDDDRRKAIYNEDLVLSCAHIGPYLIPAEDDLVVTRTLVRLNALPAMLSGNKATDGGHLIFSREEKETLIARFPTATRFLKRIYGAQEFIQGIERWTLWIPDAELHDATAIEQIANRLRAVSKSRLESKKEQTHSLASSPHRYEFSHAPGDCIIVPHTSSERRKYLTVGLCTVNDVVFAPSFVVYRPPSYLIALLSSRLHYIWAETVGGKLESRIRYSNVLVYNTFPVPGLSDRQIAALSDHTRSILKARARNPGKTIAWLYDPKTMPSDLRDAHQDNDAYIEEFVYGRKFNDDTQRLELLFSMYARTRNAGQSSAMSLSHGISGRVS